MGREQPTMSGLLAAFPFAKDGERASWSESYRKPVTDRLRAPLWCRRYVISAAGSARGQAGT